MAGTARVNPRNAPILPSPNLPRDGSFPNPAMAMGSFPPVEQPRPSMQEQRRQRPQHQQQRGPSLKRGRGFREEAAERERAARERADRMALMEREHMPSMMMMPPPHMRMGSGPNGRGIGLDPMPNSPAGIRAMYKPLGRAPPAAAGHTMYGHGIDGPPGRLATDPMYGHANDGSSGHAHPLYSHPGHLMDGPSPCAPPDSGHMMYPHPGHAFDGPSADLMYRHSGHPFNGLSGGVIDSGNGRTFGGPSGINNMDVRRRIDVTASIGNHGHNVDVLTGIGGGNRLNAPLGSPSSILRMESSSPGLLGYDHLKRSSELGASPGFENMAERVLENYGAVDVRPEYPIERRSSRLDSSNDWVPQNSRVMGTNLDMRERKLESLMGVDRRPESVDRRLESFVGMESSLENSISTDRRGEALEAGGGRVDAKSGTARSSERTISELKRPPAIARPEVASQRSLEGQMDPERTLERRVDATFSKGEDRSGSRAPPVHPANFGKGRLVALEHKENESNRDRLREDDKQMDDVGMQELVAQYKTALAELTFNSKPIITNLTIIAGENVRAARLITSAICEHILEVPVEQKLPSLYLLDSIVKNIGNEYVKQFSSRLSEVFIKSYKEVDSTLHPAMQHLFRTWRVVFNMDLLRDIEAKLQITIIGAPAPSNAAPASSSVRAEITSSQQTGQSIHVNPKYLEAQRQKLQQSSDSRVGDIGSTDQEKRVSAEDRDNVRDRDWSRGREGSSRPLEGAALRDGTRNGFELPEVPPQALVDGYGNIRGIRASNLPPASTQSNEGPDVRMDRNLVRKWQSSEQEDGITRGEGKLRLGDTNTPGYDVTKKSKSDWFHQDTNHQSVTAGPVSGGKPSGFNQSISDGAMWQRPGSLLPDDSLINGPVSHLPSSPLAETKFRAGQTASQKTSVPVMDLQVSLPVTFSGSGIHVAASRNPLSPSSPDRVINLEPSSPVPYVPAIKHHQKPPSFMGFTGSPHPTGLPPHATPPMQQDLPSTEVPEWQGQVPTMHSHNSLQSMSFPPPQRLPLNLQQFQTVSPNVYKSPSRNSAHREAPTQQAADEKPPNQQHGQAVPPIPAYLLESLQSLHQHIPPLLGDQAKPSPYQNPPQLPSHLPPVVRQENTSEFSTQKLVMLPQQSPYVSTNFAGGNLLGLLSSSESHDDTRNNMSTFLPSRSEPLLISAQAQPPLPSGPPPLLNVLSSSHVFQGQPAPSSLCASTSGLPVTSFGLPPPYASSNLMQPPLPPGPPPTSQAASPLVQPPPLAGSSPMLGNNYSSLLSSLMAQGVIAAPALAPIAPQTGVRPSFPGSASIPSVNAVSTTSVSVIRNLEASAAAFSINVNNLEFKQEALRSRDDAVIATLYSPLSKQCTICGLRFMHQEEHSTHMDWHASRNRQQNSMRRVSRKWFMHSKDWFEGKEGVSSVVVPAFFPTEVAVEPETQEEVVAVPADENQAACFLCGEPFEDFFSEENEEWMYKGAVYMKGTSGGSMESTASLHGPIVHAKCQSEAAVAHMEEDTELGTDGFNEEYPSERRKRQRT